jgi:hypothetical protein
MKIVISALYKTAKVPDHMSDYSVDKYTDFPSNPTTHFMQHGYMFLSTTERSSGCQIMTSLKKKVHMHTKWTHHLLLWDLENYGMVVNMSLLTEPIGAAVAQLVEALRYKLSGRGFDSRWCQWIFSLAQSCRSHSGPGVDSASNRNEYQEYFLGGKRGWCVRLTTLPPSCADCLEIWEPRPPGTLRACPGL